MNPDLQVEVKPSIRARKIQEEKMRKQMQKEEYWRRREEEERWRMEMRYAHHFLSLAVGRWKELLAWVLSRCFLPPPTAFFGSLVTKLPVGVNRRIWSTRRKITLNFLVSLHIMNCENQDYFFEGNHTCNMCNRGIPSRTEAALVGPLLWNSALILPVSGVMKKTCTGDVWKKSSTTGKIDVGCLTGDTPRDRLVLLGCLESGLAFPVFSPRVRW